MKNTITTALLAAITLAGVAYAQLIARNDTTRMSIDTCVQSLADREGVQATLQEQYELYGSYCAEHYQLLTTGEVTKATK